LSTGLPDDVKLLGLTSPTGRIRALFGLIGVALLGLIGPALLGLIGVDPKEGTFVKLAGPPTPPFLPTCGVEILEGSFWPLF